MGMFAILIATGTQVVLLTDETAKPTADNGVLSTLITLYSVMDAVLRVVAADIHRQAELLRVAEPHRVEVGAPSHRHLAELDYFCAGARCFGFGLSVKLELHHCVQEVQERAAPADSAFAFAGWAPQVPLNPVTQQATEYIGLAFDVFFGNGYAKGLQGVVVLEFNGACRLKTEFSDEARSCIHL